MTYLDLTEAVEAGARAAWEDVAGPGAWDRLLAESPITAAVRREVVLTIIHAAAPLIAAQVREQVAREIEAAKANVDQAIAAPGHYVGLWHAACIARGGAS